MTDSTASGEDKWTVQRILQWTTNYLRQQSVESPRLEAELLLAHAKNCQRILLYTEFETPLTDDERSRMRDFVKRRAAREPLAYITGHKEFYGREFQVGRGVLVPRPETETLIDVCLELLPAGVELAVGEVGFGSGCIAVTLAKQRPKLRVFASDISSPAFEFGAANVAKHGVGEQVELLAGSGFAPFRERNMRFDCIVSNPPYVRDDELSSLQPEVRDHEPVQALTSGDDGLELTRQLISEAPELLRPHGWMVVELDPAQCATAAALFAAAGFESATIRKDLNGDQRIVQARLPSAG